MSMPSHLLSVADSVAHNSADTWHTAEHRSDMIFWF